MPYGPFEELERRRGQLTRTAENSARLAFAYATYTSSGLGQFAYPTEVRFEVAFTERPFMAYGYYYALDGDDAVVTWPRSVGFVWDWNQDTKGLYIGASVAVIVDSPVVTVPTPAYALEHYFTFSGVAMKAFPAYLLDD